MALFGFLVSAPLGHALVKTMQKFFAGRSGPSAKLGMLAASLLVIAPIQIVVFLTNSAMVEGARSKEAVFRVVKKGFAPVLGVTWITSPTAIIFAQTFLPSEVRGFPHFILTPCDHFCSQLLFSAQFEVPFFNLVQFCTGVRFSPTPITASPN